MKKPNLFIVGAPKAGTSFLFEKLSGHPELFFPKIKELNYFSYDELIATSYYKDFKVGSLLKYEKQYSDATTEKYLVDGSVSYFAFTNVAKKIKEYNPDTKIIIILRDPVERAFSHYLMELTKVFNQIILIYTIGKVESTSVYESLKAIPEFTTPIFHVHSLNPSRIETQKKYYKQSQRNSVPFHLLQSTIISELLSSFKGGIYIFTLIREPIQRELSRLFQDSLNFSSSRNQLYSKLEDVVTEKLEELCNNLPQSWRVLIQKNKKFTPKKSKYCFSV